MAKTKRPVERTRAARPSEWNVPEAEEDVSRIAVTRTTQAIGLLRERLAQMRKDEAKRRQESEHTPDV